MAAPVDTTIFNVGVGIISSLLVLIFNVLNAKLDSVQTNLKEAQTKSETQFNTIISSQKKLAKKARKAFEDDDD